MKQERYSPDLDTVLDAYASETSTADSQELAEWIRQYPEYARDLMEFAAARSLSQHLPAAHGPEEDEETLVSRGLAVLDDLLAAPAPRPVRAGPLNDLLAAAGEQGMKAPDLADAIGLSLPLVAKLQRRLLRLATIPQPLIDELARSLCYRTEAVAEYLGRAPTLAAGANYRSDHAPTASAQQDFLEAVRSDPSIAPENRERWISVAQAQREV